jgi:hypothetical protein
MMSCGLLLVNMCLNLCHSLVPISFQSVDMCCSAWRPHVSFSLQNSSHSLSSSSHRLTLILSNLSSSLSPAPPSHPHSLLSSSLSPASPSHPPLYLFLLKTQINPFLILSHCLTISFALTVSLAIVSLPILSPATHDCMQTPLVYLSLSISRWLPLFLTFSSLSQKLKLDFDYIFLCMHAFNFLIWVFLWIL